MASAVGLIAGASNGLQAGATGLSLITATKALITSGNSADFPPGISGFIFDIPQTEEINHQANITDHFTEDNFTVQDHIAISPIKITLTGQIGNIVQTKSKLEQFVQQTLDRLTPLGVLSPQQSQSARQSLNEIQRLKSAATAVVNQFNDIAGLFSDDAGKNPQQKAYNTLAGMFLNRQNVSVETPWGTFPSMAIESFSVSQDDQSTDTTDITVTLKEIRVVTTKITKGKLSERREAQAAPVSDKGTAKGSSILKSGTDFFGATAPGSGT